MIPCMLACGGSSRTCKFPMLGNVRKTRVPMRECKPAISGNETSSFGLTKMRPLQKLAGAGGSAAEFTFCVVMAFPRTQSPIATPRNKTSRHCDVSFSIRVKTRSVELQFIFIFHLSHFGTIPLTQGVHALSPDRFARTHHPWVNCHGGPTVVRPQPRKPAKLPV